MKYYAYKKFEDGKPMLYINDKKTVPMIFSLTDFFAADPMTAYAQKNIKAFKDANIDIVQTSIFLHKTWHKITPFSVEYLKGELNAIIRANPECKIILRLHLSPPYWWLRDNPDEVCVFGKYGPYRDNGEDSERLIKDDAENFMRVSLASTKWKVDASKQIKLMLNEILKYEESDHIIGIQVAGGVYGEWHQWGFFGYHPDYSGPMTVFFRKYLKNKYKNDDNLRKAWNNKKVSINTAVLAPYNTRYFDQKISFRTPCKDKYAVDSLMAIQRSVTDAINYFAKVIKKSWDRPILVGTFYGYQDGWFHASVGGHLDVKYLAKSKYIDYWSGPFCYNKLVRNIGGVTVARGLLESARLNKILWLTEMDSAPIGTENFVGGDPKYINESISLLKRNVLEPFTKGMGMWFFDHRIFAFLSGAKNNGSIYEKYGWWENDQLMNEIGKMRLLLDSYALLPYESSSDVLVVYDCDYFYYAPGNSVMHGDTYADWYYALGKSGISYDSIYLHDLEKVDISKYKTIIFYNDVIIDEKQRKYINKEIKKNGRTVIFIHASGIMDENNKDLSLVESITEFKLSSTAEYNKMNFTKYYNGSYEAKSRFTPQFYINEDCIELSRFESGELAGGLKNENNYRTIYFSIPPSNNVFLREIFRSAGSHIYSENGESILAGNGLLVLSYDSKCDIKIKLKNNKEINDYVEGTSTIIYDLNSGERIG